MPSFRTDVTHKKTMMAKQWPSAIRQTTPKDQTRTCLHASRRYSDVESLDHHPNHTYSSSLLVLEALRRPLDVGRKPRHELRSLSKHTPTPHDVNVRRECIRGRTERATGGGRGESKRSTRKIKRQRKNNNGYQTATKNSPGGRVDFWQHVHTSNHPASPGQKEKN